MSQQWRALWVAIGYLSQSAALALGAVIATWTFSVLVVVGILAAPRIFNDWAISVLTLGLDLVLIMVASIANRTSSRQAAVLQSQAEQAAEQAKAVLTALVAIERRLHRMETLGAMPAERHPNRGGGGERVG